MAISALKKAIFIVVIFSCSTSADWSNSFSESSSTNGIAGEMMTDLHMEGTVNGHSFIIKGEGKGNPYRGEQHMSLEVVNGAPLPFSFDILTPACTFGNRVFTDYPSNIPDYFKQTFPEGYHWERSIPFQDQASCMVTSHVRMEEERRFVLNVKFHCVNFPPNGPVMQRRTVGWEPSTENMYPRDEFLEGHDDMTLRVEGGGYYRAEFRSTYKAKSSVDMPNYHFIDHRIEILEHDEDYTNVKLHEVAVAHYSPLSSI